MPKQQTSLLYWMLLTMLSTGTLSADETVDRSLAVYKPNLPDSFIQQINKAESAQGEKIFLRKCSSCHDAERSGGHGKGPHLWNIMGRKAGTATGFEKYSEAMKTSDHTWTYATLNYYLIRTEVAVPGLAMEFRGIRKERDRARLIAYLRILNDTPPTLPQ
ncbi:MAG: c-type cytochrome [Gammaproteobacteria bacterium]|nr:c-type cytochrome [Gammaproteobacteria bacterium]